MRTVTAAIGGEATPLAVGRRAFVAVALLAPTTVAAQNILLRGTPQLTLGPFFPVARGAEEDADLTRVAGQPRARGALIEVAGRILDERGNPVPGARIDVWQTNGLGAYHHAADDSGIARDPGFQGFARLTAGADGGYRFLSVMPQPYGRRQRHIHFDVEGRHRRLVTQMFFAGEPNERDSLFPAIPSPVQKEMATARRRDATMAPEATGWAYDVVLGGETGRRA
jgi:protocatechuate 3,4-dioxygenase beta subunit